MSILYFNGCLASSIIGMTFVRDFAILIKSRPVVVIDVVIVIFIIVVIVVIVVIIVVDVVF